MRLKKKVRLKTSENTSIREGWASAKAILFRQLSCLKELNQVRIDNFEYKNEGGGANSSRAESASAGTERTKTAPLTTHEINDNRD